MSNETPQEQQALRGIGELLLVTLDLYRAKKYVPSLMMTFSTIDILASLVRSDPNADNRRSDFVNWVDSYMLPYRDIDFTAIDLYAARCGFLHGMSPKSNLSRTNQAREIVYSSDDNGRRLALNITNYGSTFVVVTYHQLGLCLSDAVGKFIDSVLGSPVLRIRFQENAKQVLHSVDIQSPPQPPSP